MAPGHPASSGAAAAAAVVAATLPLSAVALPWVLSKADESCAEACTLGCWNDEQHEVASLAALQHALRAADVSCSSVVVENCSVAERGLPSVEDALAKCFGSRSAQGPFLANVGAGGECALQLVRGQNVYTCESRPPSGTSRVCACNPFDCVAGLPNWKEGWAPQKKEWCCTNVGVGCPASHKPEEKDPYDCGDWDVVWSLGQHKWCCSEKGVGCLEISNVSGTEARFATSSMTVRVRRAAVFAKDPDIVRALQLRIAQAVGVEPIQVSVKLATTASSSGESTTSGLRKADDAVLLRYTVPILKDSDHKAPLRLAGLSADDWTAELSRALASTRQWRDDDLSVLDVGEVALSNVRVVPMAQSAGSSSTRMIVLLLLAAVVVVVAVAVASMPRGEDDMAKSTTSYRHDDDEPSGPHLPLLNPPADPGDDPPKDDGAPEPPAKDLPQDDGKPEPSIKKPDDDPEDPVKPSGTNDSGKKNKCCGARCICLPRLHNGCACGGCGAAKAGEPIIVQKGGASQQRPR